MIRAPFNALLSKGMPWTDKAFLAAKQLLISSNVLVHYDPELELLLTCDAIAYGVPMVLKDLSLLLPCPCLRWNSQSQELPPLSLWKAFHSADGPQGTHITVQ